MLGNLPLQLTSFVGRETELSQVRGRLTQHRLVTLTGPGGVGKTRLALEVAASAQHTFADGVWLAELASLADPEMLPGVVAAALGLRDDGARSPVHVLAEHLRSAELLLVLDNCEHLLQACADLAEHLLRSCPRLRILATSREALRVPGEIAWLVPSLRPETDGSRLFVERASAVLPRGLAADSNAAAAEICRRLDGIPLAIELAATRLAAFTPEQLAGRLDDRFRLLTGGPRSALPRHQTLRALVDWSHDLLSQDEQRLFRRLSVFAGGWTMEAAEAVCSGGGLPRNEVPRCSRISSRSRLSAPGCRSRAAATAFSRPCGSTRRKSWTARARLLPCVTSTWSTSWRWPSLATAIHRGSDCCCCLAPSWTMCAALAWARDSGSILMGLRLAAALGTHWNVAGNPSEGHGWLLTLLDRSPANPSDHVAKAARARALGALGYLATAIGQLGAASDPLDEALNLWQELGNARQASFCVRWLGRIALLRGQPELARRYMEDALTIARASRHEPAIYEALHALGIAVHEAGDSAEAASLFEEALALAKAHQDLVWMHLCALNLGATALERGDFAAAREWLADSLAALPATNEGWVARTLEVFVALAAAQGQTARAITLAGAVTALEQTPGVTVPPRFQAAIARQIEALSRSAHAGYPAAWAAGQGMTLDAAIAYAVGGEPPGAAMPEGRLTVREREVARLLAEGLSNPQIAERLVLSRGTVKRHVENILTKLNL
ncbi:MAG TPA: LuxR C-terminal-related transcriptional regulator, partial [Chloroflexota bacterium]|nr:LuxR C-terminal-related transcriptional regulator [Chloroflexota bacterium]